MSDLCELWHERTVHLHHGAMNVLREVVTSLPDFRVEQQGVCKGCVLGKYAKATFSSSDSKSKGILDLIHSDASGPMLAVSFNGYYYNVIFIDDFGGRTWIYFMKSKDEVFSWFQGFKALVEN